MLEGVLEGKLMRRLLMDPLTILPSTGYRYTRGTDDRHATRTCASNPCQSGNGSNIYAFRANCSYRRHFETGFMLTVPLWELFTRWSLITDVGLCGRRSRHCAYSTLYAGSMPGHHQVEAWPLAEQWRW